MAALVSTLPGYSWKILGVMATTSSLLTFRNITTSQTLMRGKIKKPKVKKKGILYYFFHSSHSLYQGKYLVLKSL